MVWVFGSLASRYLRRSARDRKSQIETLFFLILIVHSSTQLTGGLVSPLIFLYVLPVLLAAFLSDVWVNGYALGAIVFLEGMGLLASPTAAGGLEPRTLAVAVTLVLIPLMVKSYLRAVRRETEELRAAVQRFRAGAQTLQALPSAVPKDPVWTMAQEDREKQIAPFLHRFERTVENLLWLYKTAMPAARHCILFLPEGVDGRFLLLNTVGGDPRDLHPHHVVLEGEGLIGFAAKTRRLYRIGRLNPKEGLIGYCIRTVRIQSVMIQPIVQGDRVEGILVIDSLQRDAFSEADEHALTRLSEQVLDAVENRRQHQAALTRSQELFALMAISESLGSRLDLQHRLETMADKVREVIPYDHCFIFLVEPGERRAELKVIRGYLDPGLAGQSISLHDGLLSLVVKKRFPMIRDDLYNRAPGRGVFPSGSGIELSPVSFLGLPMIVQDRVIGIFVMTSQHRKAFDDRHREFLRTLCTQAAISIADAKLHDEVARLATIDGLTGVNNHRRFQERLNEEFERQSRHNGAFTLVMVDVDHFKKINDRFGHPAGDKVLRQVASVLSRTVRKIDAVARYGGEEFAVILLNIGQRESFQLAERIRKAVETMDPVINGHPQKVTISLGMAVFPDDALDRQTLIECADRALYAAKRGGRNQTSQFSRIKT